MSVIHLWDKRLRRELQRLQASPLGDRASCPLPLRPPPPCHLLDQQEHLPPVSLKIIAPKHCHWSHHRKGRAIFLLCVVLVAQSCPTLRDPMGCSLPESSLCGILQARILEWVAMSFSRGSSRPRHQTQSPNISGRFFTIWATVIPFHFLCLQFHLGLRQRLLWRVRFQTGIP